MSRALSQYQYISVQSFLLLGDSPVCVTRYLWSEEKATLMNSGASHSLLCRVLRLLVVTRSNTVTMAPVKDFSATAKYLLLAFTAKQVMPPEVEFPVKNFCCF